MIVRVEGGRARVTDADGEELTVPGAARARARRWAPRRCCWTASWPPTRGELWIGDLLHLDGRDARALPFRERRALLEGLPLRRARAGGSAPVFPGGGPEVLPRRPRSRACPP